MTKLDDLADAVDRARIAMQNAKTPAEHEATTDAWLTAQEELSCALSGLSRVPAGYLRVDGPSN